MERLVRFISEKGWIRLPREQVRSLYVLYINELIDEIEVIKQNGFERKIRESFLLTLIRYNDKGRNSQKSLEEAIQDKKD